MRMLSDNSSSVSGRSEAASLAAILCKTISAKRSIAKSSLECESVGANSSIVCFGLVTVTSTRMKLAVRAYQLGCGYMQIPLCRDNRRMSEQFRDVNEVGAPVQKVGSEAMSKLVRSEIAETGSPRRLS